MSSEKNLKKVLKDYVNRGIFMKVVRKPPKLNAIQWKGDNRHELEKFMDYLIPANFIIDDLDLGDWIIVHDDGLYEVVSNREFDRLFERV